MCRRPTDSGADRLCPAAWSAIEKLLSTLCALNTRVLVLALGRHLIQKYI